jgi:hypothetical protein
MYLVFSVFTSRPTSLLAPISVSVWFFMVLMLSPSRSRDSSVGIATSYGLDDPSSSPGRVKNFLFSRSSRPALRSNQPPIQWVPLGVKRPGREVDHSPPTSAEVKKMWIYTSTPIRLHGVLLN